MFLIKSTTKEAVENVSVEFQPGGPLAVPTKCYDYKHALFSYNFPANLSWDRL